MSKSPAEKWCSQFKGCRGCKLESECRVGALDRQPFVKDGVIIDPWAIRTTAMIERALEEQKRERGET